ncbi:hypothetical protein H7097_03250 [Aeromicrobium sp.]|nr:hypothetical protein [Candidatus Saccharibacteria bacterium]
MNEMNLESFKEKVLDFIENVKRYTVILFCLFFAVIYGFIVYRVQVLNSSEPSLTDVATKSQTASVPHIDPKVLSQLQQLQDNSVSVKTLFSDLRSNPFQE